MPEYRYWRNKCVFISSLYFSSGYEDTNMVVSFQDLSLSLGLLSLRGIDLVGGEAAVFFLERVCCIDPYGVFLVYFL